MNIVVFAGGRQWVVDDNQLLMFLKQNGKIIVTQNERHDVTDSAIKTYSETEPDDLYLLKG